MLLQVGLQKWLDAAGGLSCKVGDGANLSRFRNGHCCISSLIKCVIVSCY
jgi:hypothetical protein